MVQVSWKFLESYLVTQSSFALTIICINELLTMWSYVIVCSLSLIGVTNLTESTIVDLKFGKIAGLFSISRKGRPFEEFLGIPYAEPPIEKLRFEEPEPLRKWIPGILSATAMKPECLQFDGLLGHRIIGSEDCLYLNVFTPKLSSRNKTNERLFPVMVFFHGVGFMGGSAKMYRGKFFMDEDVVLVTVSHRVAALGFLSTGDEVIPGNMGLKDQVMALKWVQSNIKQFGGDPDQVTIFGQSGGASSVHLHLLSPMSQGLFHGAISQSGSAFTTPISNKNDSRAQAKKLASKLNCSEADIISSSSLGIVECLRKVNGKALVATHEEAAGLLQGEFSMYYPTVEYVAKDQKENTSKTAFLTQHPRASLDNGDFDTTVPWIVGVNSGEGLVHTANFLNDRVLQSRIDEDWQRILPDLLQYDHKHDTAADSIRKYYFGNSTSAIDNIQNFTNMMSDRFVYLGVHNAAQSASKSNATVNLYYFSYKTQLQLFDVFFGVSPENKAIPSELQYVSHIFGKWIEENLFGRIHPFYGACHGDELSLFFNTHALMEAKTDSPDMYISEELVRLWVNFASNKTLKLFGTLWPPMNPNNGDNEAFRYMEFAVPGNMWLLPEPFAERITFWNSLNLTYNGQQL